MEVEGVAMTVTEHVDPGRETPAGTPQGVVRGLLGIFFSRMVKVAENGRDWLLGEFP
jgi:hypothetical protein